MSVICHIGLHKTASGALQRQFFPACTRLNLFTTQQRHTDSFIRAVTNTDPAYFDTEKARALLQSAMSDSKVNLISNESLSGPPYSGLIEYGLDHRTPVLLNLQSVFPDARIVIVLRRQDGLARSLYRQYLKRGGTARIDRFFGIAANGKPALMSLDRFRFLPYLNQVSSLFPEGVKIMLFENFLTDRVRFLQELSDFMGVTCPDIEIKVENATKLGPIGMEVSRVANYCFRSMINKGPMPAVPRRQFGQWRLVSPVEYLHDYWPGRGRAGKRISGVTARILTGVKDDNRLVDEKFDLGLSVHGYY